MTRYDASVCGTAMSIIRAIRRIGVSLAVYHPRGWVPFTTNSPLGMPEAYRRTMPGALVHPAHESKRIRRTMYAHHRVLRVGRCTDLVSRVLRCKIAQCTGL